MIIHWWTACWKHRITLCKVPWNHVCFGLLAAVSWLFRSIAAIWILQEWCFQHVLVRNLAALLALFLTVENMGFFSTAGAGVHYFGTFISDCILFYSWILNLIRLITNILNQVNFAIDLLMMGVWRSVSVICKITFFFFLSTVIKQWTEVVAEVYWLRLQLSFTVCRTLPYSKLDPVR